jgi:hypothetical protein
MTQRRVLVKSIGKFGTVLSMSLLSALLLPRIAAAEEPTSDTPPQPGVWQKHEYTFAFLGFTTTYSCDGLADKLKVLLTAAGARRDSKSRPGGCTSGFGKPDKFARAYLTFYTLVPSDAGSPGEGKPASGVWRSVAISDRKPRELGVGDCEVVDQFRNQVLPMFTTRNVESRISCIPHQNAGSIIDLKFEAFAPVKEAVHTAK